MKKDYLIVAEILRNRRIEKGFSLRKVALAINISHTEITRIENGERENINMRTLIKLCKFLDIDFIRLLEVAGYFEDEIEKTYEVVVTKTTEKVFKVNAKDEEKALNIISNYVFDNHIIELNSDDKIDFTAEEIEEDFEEDFEEEIDEDDEECDENCDCKNCEYYCHICGECTFGE